MFLLTGILVLVLVCAASVSLAAATGRDAACLLYTSDAADE